MKNKAARARTKRSLSRVARLQITAVTVVCLMLAGSSSAWSFWVATSTGTGGGLATAGQLSIVPNAPTVVGNMDTVIVKWPLTSPVDALASAEPTTKYVVKRYSSPGGALQTIGAGCGDIVAGIGCTELHVPAGTWQYTITSRMGTNWSGIESPKSDPLVLSGAFTSDNVYMWVTSN